MVELALWRCGALVRDPKATMPKRHNANHLKIVTQFFTGLVSSAFAL